MYRGLSCAALLVCVLCAGPALAQQPGVADHDRDKDGRMSRAEYRTAAASQVTNFDKNKDGKITRSELPLWAKAPGIRGRVNKIWVIYDASADGAITLDEVRFRADVRFDQLDANKDTFVTQLEIDAAR